jgi:tetratricopeptide (TPR) repeat protein
VDRAYREGLLLAPYFHEGLQVFEPSGTGIRQYLPELFDRLDIEVERERFAAHFDTIPVPESQPVRAEVPSRPLPDPVRELLAEAQAAFNEQRNEAAAVSFRRVLEELDPENGPALYGLALLASRSQDPDRAREYFSRTLASETAEPDMVVWSHVYLGRIEDLSCNREAALDHYRNAVGAGNDTGGAQAAARQGLEAQYGGNC